jgi:hypothetical protein
MYLDEPTWVILFGKYRIQENDQSFATLGLRDPEALPIDLQADYTETVLPVYFSDLSRPELSMHSFTEIKPKYDEQIFIYHKKQR